MTAHADLFLTVVAPPNNNATSVVFTNFPSGSVTVTGFEAPGTVLTPIVVQPAGWTGNFTISGSSGALFTVVPSLTGASATGSSLAVGSTQLVAGTYPVTVTANP